MLKILNGTAFTLEHCFSILVQPEHILYTDVKKMNGFVKTNERIVLNFEHVRVASVCSVSTHEVRATQEKRKENVRI